MGCAIAIAHWHQSLPARADGKPTPSNEFQQRIGDIISHECLFAKQRDDRKHDGIMICEVLLQNISVLMTGLIVLPSHPNGVCYGRMIGFHCICSAYQFPMSPQDHSSPEESNGKIVLRGFSKGRKGENASECASESIVMYDNGAEC